MINFLFIMSNVAKPIAARRKIKELMGNSSFVAPRATAIPANPSIVATHLCQIIFSLKKKYARIRVNKGIVKLIKVAVERGTTFSPYVHAVMPKNNIRPRIK